MVTVNEVLSYVGGSDTQLAQRSLDEATALVHQYAGVHQVYGQTTDVQGRSVYGYYYENSSGIPDNIIDRAILETSSELYHRRNAPSGIQQFAGVEGTVARLNKDPMSQSYALLNKWLVGM